MNRKMTEAGWMKMWEKNNGWDILSVHKIYEYQKHILFKQRENACHKATRIIIIMTIK